MIERVKKILSIPIATIVNSSHVIELMRLYSTLYLGGGPCGSCVASCRKYYDKLKINGLYMADKYVQAKNRTCVPAFKGSKYIAPTCKHWYPDMLTDEDANYLLMNGYLTEKSFIKLPDSYLNKENSNINILPVILNENIDINNTIINDDTLLNFISDAPKTSCQKVKTK